MVCMPDRYIFHFLFRLPYIVYLFSEGCIHIDIFIFSSLPFIFFRSSSSSLPRLLPPFLLLCIEYMPFLFQPLLLLLPGILPSPQFSIYFLHAFSGMHDIGGMYKKDGDTNGIC